MITIDFETYYDSAYSLSKLTMEEYIRSPEFEIIGVAVKVDDDSPSWFSGSMEDVREWLDQFDLPSQPVLAHNAMFDMAILSWRLGIQPKLVLDTLSMARPIHGLTVGGSLSKLATFYRLGAKGTEVVLARGLHRRDFSPRSLTDYGDYCKNDCELTYQLYQKLRPQTLTQEIALIDETIRMFTQPALVLDRALLEQHLQTVRTDREMSLLRFSAMARIHAGLNAGILGADQYAKLLHRINEGDEQVIILLSGNDTEQARKMLMSNLQFADLLRLHGVIPPMKTSPTTGQQTYAFAKTDKEFQKLLNHENHAVQVLASARIGIKSTIEETRTERMLGIAKRGMFPVPINYAGAITTLRWSGGDKINTQNFPRGGTLRRSIMAVPGSTIVVGDSSQIELRVNHCLAGQEDSVKALREGRDLYSEFSTETFGKPLEEITPAERFMGKVAHLQLQYASGADKYRDTVRILSMSLVNRGIIDEPISLTDQEARDIVGRWRSTYSKIPALWAQAQEALKAMCIGSEATVGRQGIVKTFNDGAGPGIGISIVGFEFCTGHKIRYPDLRYDGEQYVYYSKRGQMNSGSKVKIYGGKAVENIVQSLARHILAEQWLIFKAALKRDYPRWRIVLQVHDELVATGPKHEAEDVAALLKKILSTSPRWWPEIPLAAEIGIADRYGDAK